MIYIILNFSRAKINLGTKFKVQNSVQSSHSPIQMHSFLCEDSYERKNIDPAKR